MTDTGNKIGLPRDIGHKIMAMLKPKARPEGVLCFHEKYIYFQDEVMTEDEVEQLVANGECWVSFTKKGFFIESSHLPRYNAFVRVALFQGFRFKDEASRARWKNDEDFEMYRDAIYSIDT